MTHASPKAVRSGIVAALIATLAADGAFGQDRTGEQQPLPPSQASQAPAEEPLQEDPLQEESDSSTDPPSYLFGPRLELPPDTVLPPADRPPTPLLVGPYLPEGSIELPATSDLETGQIEGEEVPLADGTAGMDGEAPADDIDVVRLESLDPAAIGIWEDEAVPALPVDMWDGTPRSRLAAMLRALSLAAPSPTLRALGRRLLLSPARVPNAEEGEPGADILALRLDRLAQGGAVDDLLALAAQIPAEEMTEDIERLRADAHLLAGELDAACSLARAAVRRSGAIVWLRILTLCEALEGNRAAAFFQLNLIEEAGVDDPALFALVEALLAADADGAPPVEVNALDRAERLDPLLFALARLTDAKIPARLVETAEPMVLALLLESPGLNEGAHPVAVGRGLAAGLIEGETLADIYAAMSFTEGDLARVFEYMAAEQDGASSDIDRMADIDTDEAGATVEPPPTGMALDAMVFQRVLAAQTPQEKARWIEIALERARARDLAPETARALAGPLATVPPGAELAAFADTAGLIYLIAGNFDSALAWYDAARSAARSGDADATEAVIALWPFLVIADSSGTVPYSERLLELWWQNLEDLPEHERLALGDRLFSMFRELGKAVPERFEERALAGPHSRRAEPPVALWRSLIAATMAGRTGEALLAALAGLDHGGPAAADPSFAATAVGALARLGFETEARRLALEALADDGFRHMR